MKKWSELMRDNKDTIIEEMIQSFIDLLKDCDKEGVNIESFLKYVKEQEGGINNEFN